LLPKRIALDGANIAWSLGTSVRSRFKCRQFPLSAGVVHALEYEPWVAKNFEVVAFLPKEYVVGGLQTLCDGGGPRDAQRRVRSVHRQRRLGEHPADGSRRSRQDHDGGQGFRLVERARFG
jgi:hypothetical protein